MGEAYIVSAVRTAGGRRGGRLSGWHPGDLAAKVIDELVDRAKADPKLVDDVILGCVSQAGEQTNNVARMAVLASKLPEEVPGTTIDRQCGSSQQAIQFAAQAVMSGTQDIVIAGGTESMTRVPMGSPTQAMIKAGIPVNSSEGWQKRTGGKANSQFGAAELIAKKYGMTKEQLDQFGLKSQQLAGKAHQAGAFKDEILPIEITLANGEKDLHVMDEGIRLNASIDAIRNVRLLSEDGILTAATSSQMCDGASGVMVVNERGLKALGVEPLARIHHMSVMGDDPYLMLHAPVPATKRALQRAGMKIDDIDLYEVNEAFAPIPLAWLESLKADPEKLNVNGGAMALGHPLGASGAKLMATLLYALKNRKKKWGLQTMCEGGGMANVTIVENLM